MPIVTPNRQPSRGKGLITIENTRFIFRTNFAGDPARDTFGSDARQANIIIPTQDQADELLAMGVNVKETKPRPGEEEGFVPRYFAAIKANYDSQWPPKVYLVSGDSEPRRLDAGTVGMLDNCYVKNVNVVLNPYTNTRTGRTSLYVRTMYVEQNIEDDPFRSRYVQSEDDEEVPFDM